MGYLHWQAVSKPCASGPTVQCLGDQPERGRIGWVEARERPFHLHERLNQVESDYVPMRGSITKRPAHGTRASSKQKRILQDHAKECTVTDVGSMQIRRMKKVGRGEEI